MSKPDGDVHMQALAESIANQASLLLRLTPEWKVDRTAAFRIDSAIGRAIVLLSKSSQSLRPDMYPDD
jgi:hypothetical protein